MKTPKNVGEDFDSYADAWKGEGYEMEDAGDGTGMRRDPNAELAFAGDEWGKQDVLIAHYKPLFERYLPSGPIRFLEIGAGGGRATDIVVKMLGDRIERYTIVDVSRKFTEIIQARIDFDFEMVIVDDVDLSKLPSNTYDFCLSQSCWSHISLYDQYRYLRDLRRVMKYRAPVAVFGQFLLGVGNDWTFNRFKRRVHQIDKSIEGVYHEFTSVGVLGECLNRLQYDIDLIYNSGFIARRNQANDQHTMLELREVSFPYCSTLAGYLAGEEVKQYTLPR